MSNLFNTLTYAAGLNIDGFDGEGAEGDGRHNKMGPVNEIWRGA